MRSKFKWIFTLLLAFSMQFSFAQEKTVAGVVTENGMPLPGVSVVVKGTTNGTQTDFDGKYSIKTRAGQVLEFSYIGLKSQSITVGASNSVNVAMTPDAAVDLGEVVIIGYGKTTKEAYVGTAAKVEVKNIQSKSVSNITQALSGEVAGVNVIQTSGQPGTAATIRIRGFGSVNGNRDPLYVVDGVPFDGGTTASNTINLSALNTINPSDIENLTILKDATATAVYGARGANGVVVITTRSGKSNRSSIEVDFKTGVNVSLLPRYESIKSPEEYIGISWTAMRNRGVLTGESNPESFANANLFGAAGINTNYNMWNVANTSELIDPLTGQVRAGVTRKYNPEDWEDYGFQTSYRQEANLRFSGGNEKTRYFSSIGYLDDQGYVINTDFKRYTTRLNLNHEIRDWLKGGASMGYTVSRTNNPGQSSDSNSVFWFVDNIPSIYPLFLRDANGDKVADPFFGGNQYDYGTDANGLASRGFGGLTNSIADATYNKSRTDEHNLIGQFSLDAKLNKYFSLESRFGLNYSDTEFNDRTNPFYGSGAAASTKGSLFKRQTRFLSQNFLQMLRFDKEFGNHRVDAFIAHESNTYEQNFFSASRNRVVVLNSFDLASYTQSQGVPTSFTRGAALESYFSQVNYNYDSKYYFTASVRRDGSSRFRSEKWGTFGSIGGSWIMSKESFLADSKSINFLKLKTSYGLIGDQQGVGLWPGYDTYDVTDLNGDYSVTVRDNGNRDLTWETAKIFQVGVESSLFGFLDVNLDYYIKNTDDLIFKRRTPPSSGVALVTVNDGQLRNTGLEFDLKAQVIKHSGTGFNLELAVNGEYLKNEITTMPIDPATGAPKFLDNSNSPYGWTQGGSIYDFYLREWAGVNAATGSGLWNQYYNDINADGIFNTGDVAIANLTNYMAVTDDVNLQQRVTDKYADATLKFVDKSAIPKVRGAFRMSATYKNFDISSQFTYSLGGYAYDFTYANLMDDSQVGSNNWHTDVRGRWQQPGDITDIPRLGSGADAGSESNSLSTRFLTKSDFLALNNVRLGYTVPDSFVKSAGFSKVNLFVTGDNLMFLSERKGFNPSTSENGSSDTYTYSPLSTFTMGVRLEF